MVMNRKIIVLLSLILLITTSCFDKVDSSSKLKELISNCEPFDNFKVPIDDGKVTVVCMGGDTLAVTSIPMTIKVPKNRSSVTTRTDGNNFEVHFIGEDNENYEVLKNKTYSSVWQAVMFEDTRVGDYDYNDLVIHVNNRVDTPWGTNKFVHSIRIQPIALGSSKNIGLGCVLSDYSEHIISNNVREDLFKGNKGFINTVNEDTPIRFKLEQTNIYNHEMPYSADKACWVAWFIEVDGMRQYAISGDYEFKDYSNAISRDLLPYGLVIADDNGTFKYPTERTSIFDTYPMFKDWVYNSNANIGKPIKENIYKYCIDGLGEDGKKKIWDYSDLE